MLWRSLFLTLLTSAALVLELGIPVWTGTPLAPSSLDLVLVLLFQFVRGAELVFWCGLIGFCEDFARSGSFGPAIIGAASLGMLWTSIRPGDSAPSSLLDRALSSLGLLALIGGIRLFTHAVSGATLSKPQVTILIGRLAITWLACLIIILLIAGALPRKTSLERSRT